jgi:hypothetical protein
MVGGGRPEGFGHGDRQRGPLSPASHMDLGCKASLANTADADILEYILGKIAKLRTRIAAKARTFLVKIKAHRGEALNERADDLAEVGRTLDSKEMTTSGRTGRRGWYIHTMIRPRISGREVLGAKRSEMQRGGGRRNL